MHSVCLNDKINYKVRASTLTYNRACSIWRMSFFESIALKTEGFLHTNENYPCLMKLKEIEKIGDVSRFGLKPSNDEID